MFTLSSSEKLKEFSASMDRKNNIILTKDRNVWSLRSLETGLYMLRNDHWTFFFALIIAITGKEPEETLCIAVLSQLK